MQCVCFFRPRIRGAFLGLLTSITARSMEHVASSWQAILASPVGKRFLEFLEFGLGSKKTCLCHSDAPTGSFFVYSWWGLKTSYVWFNLSNGKAQHIPLGPLAHKLAVRTLQPWHRELYSHPEIISIQLSICRNFMTSLLKGPIAWLCGWGRAGSQTWTGESTLFIQAHLKHTQTLNLSSFWRFSWPKKLFRLFSPLNLEVGWGSSFQPFPHFLQNFQPHDMPTPRRTT